MMEAYSERSVEVIKVGGTLLLDSLLLLLAAVLCENEQHEKIGLYTHPGVYVHGWVAVGVTAVNGPADSGGDSGTTGGAEEGGFEAEIGCNVHEAS